MQHLLPRHPTRPGRDRHPGLWCARAHAAFLLSILHASVLTCAAPGATATIATTAAAVFVATRATASPASTLPLPSRPRFDGPRRDAEAQPHGSVQSTADGGNNLTAGEGSTAAPAGPSMRYTVIAPEGRPVTPTPDGRPPDDADFTEAQRQYMRWAYGVLASLRFHKGEVELPRTGARLDLGAGYEFLETDDARLVLEEVWGNPPADAPLGLIVPEGQTPFAADSWGIVLHYRPIGRVPDGDRERIDFAALITPLQSQIEKLNAQRSADGYATAALLGWSALPRYDLQRHVLQWGTMSQFSNEASRTMNYEVRLLGRAGVLSMSIVADANHYPQIVARVPAIIGMFTWLPGNTYDDYDEDTDVRAAGGLDTLITGTLPAPAESGASWWWLLLLLPVLAVAAWLYLRRPGGRAGWRDWLPRLRVRTR